MPHIRRQRRLTSTVFQQDGAPPHFSLLVRNFISSVFPNNRVISRGFPQNWPAHSPDITPLDYYFWPTLKSRVYFNFRSTNLHELRQRIENVIGDFDQEELRRSVLNLTARLQHLLDSDGGPIEQCL